MRALSAPACHPERRLLLNVRERSTCFLGADACAFSCSSRSTAYCYSLARYGLRGDALVTLDLALTYGAILGFLALIGILVSLREIRRDEARRRAAKDS